MSGYCTNSQKIKCKYSIMETVFVIFLLKNSSNYLSMPSINDVKCVLITGATSGIGKALAARILALPSSPKVIAVGRRQDRLDEMTKLDRVEVVQFNVD